MHSFLISGRDEEKLAQKAEELVKKLEAQPLPFVINKIADIRQLKQLTRLKVSEKTAVVVKNFEGATEEAQNAFLKALEEPQDNLFYVLTVITKEPILPTILSRCQIMEIASPKLEISDKDQKKIEKFLQAGTGEKLVHTSSIKNREDAIVFVEKIIIWAHGELLAGENVLRLVKVAKETLQALKANGNLQLQLTKFVVNLEN